MSIRGIVFDLDGTLINSYADYQYALNQAFGEGCMPEQPDHRLNERISQSPKTMIRAILESNSKPVNESSIQQAYQAFLQHYARSPTQHTQLFPYVKDDLFRLHAAGLTLGVCTNKVQSISEDILEHLGLKSLFAAVMGADSVIHPKPHPAHLLATIERLGLEADQVVYLGDTAIDRDCAISAGVAWYIVGWSSDAELGKAEHRRIGRLSELQQIISQSKQVPSHDASISKA